LFRNATREFDEVRSLTIKPPDDSRMMNVECSGDVEVAAAVLEEVEGSEVLVALGKASLVASCSSEFIGGIVGGEAAFDIMSGVEAVVLVVDDGELGVRVGFGEAVLDEVVEAWFAGGLDVGGDALAAGADCAGQVGEVSAMQVVLVVEEGDEGEVFLGVGEQLWEVGVAGEAGVVVGDEVEKLFSIGDGGGVDGGVPDSDWRAFRWSCWCLGVVRGRPLLLAR
jgi:hypothetical protein